MIVNDALQDCHSIQTFPLQKLPLGQLPYRLQNCLSSAHEHALTFCEYQTPQYAPSRTTTPLDKHHRHIDTNPRTNPACCQPHVYTRCRQCPTDVCIRFTCTNTYNIDRHTHISSLCTIELLPLGNFFLESYTACRCGRLPSRIRKPYLKLFVSVVIPRARHL